MAKHGKKFRAKSETVDPLKRYKIDDALKMLGTLHFAKFDETVDIALRLGVDPKHSDQMVRGSVAMPNGMGKKVRIAVFARGDKLMEAQNAGADLVGGEDLVEKVQGGFMDFDVAIATPDMMGVVSKIGKILGPRGLMPNPKTGTVTPDVAKAIREAKAGKVDFRVDKAGIIHAPLGKISFGPEKLKGNFTAFMEVVQRAKPSSAKGKYLRNMVISTTMSPGVKIDMSEFEQNI